MGVSGRKNRKKKDIPHMGIGARQAGIRNAMAEVASRVKELMQDKSRQPMNNAQLRSSPACLVLM